MKIVHSLPTDIWRQFVDQHPAGNIFHTPEMFQVFSRVRGYTPELWAIVEHNKITNMMMPVHISLWGGFFKSLTTRSVVYGGLLCTPEGNKNLHLFLESYKTETGFTLFTEFRHLSDPCLHKEILAQQGFQFFDQSDYLINLANPLCDVWEKVGKSTRKNIRKAINKSKFCVEELVDREKLPIWYSLIKMTFDRARVPLADISLFEAAFDILHSKGMVQFLLGKVDSTYVAASVALLYKDVIFGWYRGFNSEYSRYIPNDLMVWHLLEWGANNGYRIFDFGGAGDPNEAYGPRSFKAKFGGELVNFGRSTYAHKPLELALSKMGYTILRKFKAMHDAF